MGLVEWLWGLGLRVKIIFRWWLIEGESNEIQAKGFWNPKYKKYLQS